ncbi:FxLYD domain-containing protein [Natronolimnohabitans sp. A-GB9]|uniref:FxLYD domain-containing protein n=1 Tax=Natronolimnohabitans sp. A-GB9 TaxID=3069757 RepID=UPI0027AE3036|nr:FxLYD domain-containing protein [Natronolimnohabitans sp. A-GB9]MDQ2052797.1 FxLYD domain-containing protein [Natronolimnohabitans sp. A-GB9]
MRRRQVLLGTGVAIPTILAGCAGDEGADDDTADEDDDTGTDDSETDANGTDDDTSEVDDDDDEDDGEDEADEDTDDEADDELEIDPDSEPPVEGLRITELELLEDEYSTTVAGVIANGSGEDLVSVEVGAVFYDENGQRVDESVTTIGEMDEEEELGFEIMSLESDVVEVDVAITGGGPASRSPGS